jgi:hypothetical protein
MSNSFWDKGFVSGAKAERERIIKLFESRSECSPITGHDWNGNCYCEHIALIKGENKQEYPQALPLPPKTPENTQPNWTGF